MKGLFSHPWDELIEAKKQRLRAGGGWFPYPLLLSFVLVILFTSHAVFGTAPRLGNPANLLTFQGEPFKMGTIWFSVTPIDDEIVVTTEDRKVFRWSQHVRKLDEIKPFTDYLVAKSREAVLSSTLAKDGLKRSTKAVIAADQRLKYLHFRPILYALAAAKITKYGFETRTPNLAVKTDYLETTDL
jgi:hypothetical protein